MKRLLRVVVVDGKASTDGIRKALGMFDGRFHLLGLILGISYGTGDSRYNKQAGASVTIFTRTYL